MRIVNRVSFLKDICKDKTVLDLGCVDHDHFTFKDKMNRGEWLHEELSKATKKIIGVDMISEYSNEIRERGYDIRHGNIENFEGVEINEKIDVIIAGEIIEHLFNQGLFLDSVKKFMDNETVLVITTPNSFSLRKFIHILFRNREINRIDHTLWHSQNTLEQMLKFKNFQIKEILCYAFMKQSGIGTFIQKIFYKLRPRLADELIFIIKK